MNIEKYIYDLLFFYDLVIVPDLGGFITNYKPAEINKTAFTPPTKSVMFNSELKNNDGLLLNAIIKHEKISQTDATQKINDFVLKTKNNLNNKKNVLIENVGQLQQTKNNLLIFEPCEKSNFLFASYGFDKFNTPLIENQLQKKLNTNSEINHFLSSRKLKQLAVGVPLALLLTLIPYKSNMIKNLSSFNVFQTYSKTEKALPYDSVTVKPKSIDNAVNILTKNKSAFYFKEKTKESVSVKKEDKKITTKNVTPKTKKVEKVKEEPKQEINETSTILLKYRLISGSFKDENNAKKRLKKLQAQGLNPTLEKKKNRYRIIAASFNTKSEAKSEVKKLKHKKIACWIYTAK